jgi:glycosyltransferase involved in cell wall biosynthesis
MLRRELVSILVPVYNEARTVAAVVHRLLTIDLPVDREIIVINDGSTDDTHGVLAGLTDVDGRLQVIHAQPNAGKGAAIRAGLARSQGTIVAIQDADLELDPAQLGSLLEPILRGESDVVYGSRFLAGRPAAPWVTIAANRGLTFITNVLFGSRLTDMETCYKIMRTDVARSLNLTANRFEIEPEITAKLLMNGHAIVERPVQFSPRNASQGKKIGWRDGVRAVRVLVAHRFTRSSSPASETSSAV